MGNNFLAKSKSIRSASTPRYGLACRSAGKGFTLIEFLVYLSIVSMAVISLVTFILAISNSRNKNYVVQEVHANVRTALDIVGQRIRDATDVNIVGSTFDTDPGVLSLAMSDVPSKNPTVIDLTANDGILRISEGAIPTVSLLTSDEVKVTNLIFRNLTSSGVSRETIRVELTISYANPGSKAFVYTEIATTTVSVRQ